MGRRREKQIYRYEKVMSISSTRLVSERLLLCLTSGCIEIAVSYCPYRCQMTQAPATTCLPPKTPTLCCVGAGKSIDLYCICLVQRLITIVPPCVKGIVWTARLI